MICCCAFVCLVASLAQFVPTIEEVRSSGSARLSTMVAYDRTYLAYDRTYFAYDRTYFAYDRTYQTA